jgi:4-hydroxyphenylpyruvate dioxygenase-like putative hemolysin
MAAQDIEYVELYTSDMRSAVSYFVSSLGFTLMAECAAEGSRSALLRHRAVQLLVTAGRGTEEFIEAHGDGIADIALGCDDPARACERAVAAGTGGTLTDYADFCTEAFGLARYSGEYIEIGEQALDSRLPGIKGEIAGLRTTNVLADRDEWGYLFQLFTRSPYKRNTLFYELVQRRGARGFGTANIRALYEAVERDEQGSAG